MPPPFKLIDLFCGAGGLSLGFVGGNRFKTVWANDFNRDAVSTFNQNFGPSCVHGDLTEILDCPRSEIPEADIVVGGPPCQGFSLLNKKKENDPRKELWKPFFEVVRRSCASAFLMENVPQLLGSEEFERIEQEVEQQGFKVTSGVLNAADYGVPQRRCRAFIFGAKRVDPSHFFPPRRTHIDPSKAVSPTLFPFDYVRHPKPWVTVRDAIGDLPNPIGTQIRDVPPPLDLHFGRTPTPTSLLRYRAIPDEGMNRFDLQERAPELTPKCWIRKTSGGTDLFGRLWWDRPSFTIRTEFYKPEKGRYLHPSQHRPITHREAARFQSFPDEFVFVGSKIEIARQIGNAVPPRLASALAESVYALMIGDSKTNEAVGSDSDKRISLERSMATPSVI